MIIHNGGHLEMCQQILCVTVFYDQIMSSLANIYCPMKGKFEGKFKTQHLK